MTDKPAENARRKSQNSMAIGMDLLKTNEADAFVTAGNTGGAMATAPVSPRSYPRRETPGAHGFVPRKRWSLRGFGYRRKCRLQARILATIRYHGICLC